MRGACKRFTKFLRASRGGTSLRIDGKVSQRTMGGAFETLRSGNLLDTHNGANGSDGTSSAYLRIGPESV